MSSYHMDLQGGGRSGKLRFEISHPEGKEEWQCFPADFLGAGRGAVAWRGARELGLFSFDAIDRDPKLDYPQVKPGASAYAILEIPDIGLDSVMIGQGDTARLEQLGSGSWTLTRRTIV